MSASPSLSPLPPKQSTSLPRRLFRWALAAIVVVMLLFAIAIWNNNHSLRKRSRAEFNAQLDHAIETSTHWTVTNPVNYGNPNAVFGSATFGRISATNLTYPNMRQIQLGAKLMF